MSIKPLVALPAALLSVGLVAGCGPSGSTAAGSSSSMGSSSSTSSSAAASTDTSSPAAADTSCPTSNTKAFAKTRFVTDLGLAAGTFHRYLWKPYQAGTFRKGANGRIKAILKGAATAALDVHLLSNAKDNAKANPTLCKVLYQPISDAVDKLGSVKGDIASGSFGSLTSLQSIFTDIENKAKNAGTQITESTNESQASNG